MRCPFDDPSVGPEVPRRVRQMETGTARRQRHGYQQLIAEVSIDARS